MPKDIILKALLGGLYFFVADNEKLNSMQARKERQYANFGESTFIGRTQTCKCCISYLKEKNTELNVCQDMKIALNVLGRGIMPAQLTVWLIIDRTKKIRGTL